MDEQPGSDFPLVLFTDKPLDSKAVLASMQGVIDGLSNQIRHALGRRLLSPGEINDSENQSAFDAPAFSPGRMTSSCLPHWRPFGGRAPQDEDRCVHALLLTNDDVLAVNQNSENVFDRDHLIGWVAALPGWPRKVFPALPWIETFFFFAAFAGVLRSSLTASALATPPSTLPHASFVARPAFSVSVFNDPGSFRTRA